MIRVIGTIIALALFTVLMCSMGIAQPDVGQQNGQIYPNYGALTVNMAIPSVCTLAAPTSDFTIHSAVTQLDTSPADCKSTPRNIANNIGDDTSNRAQQILMRSSSYSVNNKVIDYTPNNATSGCDMIIASGTSGTYPLIC